MTADNTARLKVVFVGHVDHGKSTLIGRIFHDTNSLPDGKIDQIKAACREEGMEFEYSFLLDSLLEEQEQNITIDTTQIQFKTDKRPYVIIDAPGHKEFLKNMITGAASADAAVLLIAANEGVREQSRRHGYLLSLLGISQVVVAVNKMDLVDHDEEVFEKVVTEYSEFLKQIGLTAQRFVPISARTGANVASKDGAVMPWYSGPSITDTLDSFTPPPALNEMALRFPIQDVYRFDARRIIAGRVEAGTLRVGDTLVFSPNNKTSVVASIERWSAPPRDFAVAGESVGITLTEQIFVERGHVASHEADAPIESNRFKARLFWMGKRNLAVGERTKLKLATQELDAEVVSIERIIDASTLDSVAEGRQHIARNDVAEVTIQTRGALVFDNADRNPLLGRFVIVDDRKVAGGGIIFGGTYLDRTKVKSQNIFWSEGTVTAQHRALRNGHKGAVVWLTGLSGAGKSTIACALERELFNQGLHTYVLDGDNVRHGLNSNLGFSPEDREENIRRVAEVAKLLADSGTIAITAFISPYRADRVRAREVALEGGADFIEIFVSAPLEVCEQRDPKQLYKKARAGEITQFTGIDAPYEAPENAEIVVHTDRQTLNESLTEILEKLLPRVKTAEDSVEI
ncbi:MAG: bifunctional enzyme CysN/CysC [Chthoniobacter sp.]|jgi:bifunctional enzyme CysN/CysC|nr:bifunctional enzyme CysN/CysC [Chthoniobacter sp.]